MTVLPDSSAINMKKVLFVCTGNTCRSPIAEAIFNQLAEDKGFIASSCGTLGDGESRISNYAKAVLIEEGIDFDHISTPVTKDLIKEANYVVGMTSNHAMNLISMFPDNADKIYAMPKDITDPYGSNLDIYRKCKNEIAECVKIIINTLEGNKND